MQLTKSTTWSLSRLSANLPFALTSGLTPALVWSIWGITRVIMLVNLIAGHHYADPEFYLYGGQLAIGKLPFFNFPVEYPPLALVFILLPALPLLPFAGIAPRPESIAHLWSPDPVRYQAYGISFGLMMLVVDAVTMILVMRIASTIKSQDKTGLMSGLLYTLLMFASGAVLQKFELVVALLTLSAFWMLLHRKDGWAWAFLAMATLVKGYPILLAPIFIIWYVSTGRFTWYTIKRAIIGGGLASLALVGPIIIVAGIRPLLYGVLYHADRGIEIETIWSSASIVIGWFTGTTPISYYNPADLSADIRSIYDPQILAFATPILVGVTLAAYFALYRRLRDAKLHIASRVKQMPILSMYVLHAILVVMFTFLLTFRALGLHYIVGILPLVALLQLPGKLTGKVLTTVFAGLIVGQFAVSFFPQLIALDPSAEWLLIGRNAFLVLSLGILICAPLAQLWKKATRETYHEQNIPAIANEPVSASV